MNISPLDILTSYSYHSLKNWSMQEQEREFCISLNSKIWINDLTRPLEGTYDRFKVTFEKDTGKILKLGFRKLNCQVDEFDGDSLVFKEHRPKSLSRESTVKEGCANWDILRIHKQPNPDRIYRELYSLTPNPIEVDRCRVNGFQLSIGGVEGFTIETRNGTFNFQTEEVTSVTRDNNNNKLVITTIDKENRPKQVPFNLDEIRRVTFVS